MKKLIPLFALFIVALTGCTPSGHLVAIGEKARFVEKVSCSCSKTNGQSIVGFKLTFPPYHIPPNYTGFPCTYEKDKVFAGYPNREKIEILEQLLGFEGDTSLCSQTVCRYGYSTIAKPLTVTYTIQIDALYLITLLTVSSHSPYYCPYPVLVDKTTGEEINNNPVKLKEVFDIYTAWIAENKKHDFKNYGLPLKGSKYEWYGTRKDIPTLNSYTFSIKQLDASAVVIGNCLD